MQINPSDNNIDLTASFPVAPKKEQAEAHQAQRDVAPDHDTDDKSSKPTVNTSGQTIGTLINTKA